MIESDAYEDDAHDKKWGYGWVLRKERIQSIS